MLVTTAYGEQIKVVLFPDEKNTFAIDMSWQTDSGPLHYTLQLTKSFTVSLQKEIENQIITRLVEKGVLETMHWLQEPLDLLDIIRSVENKEIN